jgi:hypothetical protein
VLVAGYGVPQLLGKLTVILGGIGLVESGMVGLYAILGIPKTGAVVVALGYKAAFLLASDTNRHRSCSVSGNTVDSHRTQHRMPSTKRLPGGDSRKGLDPSYHHGSYETPGLPLLDSRRAGFNFGKSYR